jgi:chaperone LolA
VSRGTNMWHWFATAALLLPVSVQAITGAEVIERMQERFADAKSYEARFEKRFYWAVLDKSLSRQGRIYTRRPGQFRVEVEGGDLVVADGGTIWAYNKANDQVIVSHYRGELRTPWEILVQYTEGYRTVAVEESKQDGREIYKVTLQPRENMPTHLRLKRLRVWVDRKHWHLLRVEQVEANDDVRTYVLTGHRINKKLKDELFEFQVPDDAQVVDQRTSPGGS